MGKQLIELSGGFHNSDAIRVRIADEVGPIGRWSDLERWLSLSQIARLERHFCGIAGCTCGGPRRAELLQKP